MCFRNTIEEQFLPRGMRGGFQGKLLFNSFFQQAVNKCLFSPDIVLGAGMIKRDLVLILMEPEVIAYV